MQSTAVRSERANPPDSRNEGGTWRRFGDSEPWGGLYLFAIVAGLYVAGAGLALLLIEELGLEGVFFIPAGVTVAFLIRLTRRSWWIVLLAAGLSELTMDLLGGWSVVQSLGFAAANVVEPLVGASVVIAACGPLDLARREHVLWFIVGAVLAGPAVGAGVGAGADFLLAGDDFAITFGQWWLGDALGVVLIGSAILVWGSSPDHRSLFSYWGASLIVGSMVLTTAILSLTQLPLLFLVLIGVVIAGALFGPRATAMTSLAIATTVAAVVLTASDPLVVGLQPWTALLVVKLQIATFSLAGMIVAAESHEREIAIAEVARASLESAVAERNRQRDHDLAVEVQRGLLPAQPVSKPGFDIAAKHTTAEALHEVGGDWWDVVELPSGRFGLVVGDIVGHGIGAMTSMGRLRTAFSALAMHNEDPASLLNEVDGFVGSSEGADYATIFYAIVDPVERTVQYASAGHPPALMVTPDGETTWLEHGQSSPLSGHFGTPRKWERTPLLEDAVVVLYTDGLVERRGEPLDVGLERLRALTETLTELRAHEIAHEMINRLRIATEHEDDALVLVLKSERESVDRFVRTYPTSPDQLRRIRTELRDWSAGRDVPEAALNDLLLAVGEATSNAVRHAHEEGSSGVMRVDITAGDTWLETSVADDGIWTDPPVAGGHPGMGLSLIRGVAHDFDITRKPSGTVLRFRISIRGNA